MKRRTLTSACTAILRPSALLLVAAVTAGAQVSGPKDTAPKNPPATPKAPATLSQRFEKEGIAVDFSMKAIQGEGGNGNGLAEGADAVVSFSVTDKRTGQPITGLRPKAWISARASGGAANESECKDKVRTFMGGLLSVRADVDLNSYVMLTLNHDKTITFINPQVAFNVTKLESIITLPGAGADWALSKDKEFLYLTMPEVSQVAVVNTITRKVVATVPTGEKTRPMRIAIQPDGRYVWVGLDGSPSVAAIDAATNKLAATVPVGAGLHNIAFTSDGRLVYVTNSASDTVTAIDTKTLNRISDIAVGRTPAPVAFSSASGFVYVAGINGGDVSVINPTTQQVIKVVPLKRGLVALRFDPSGRYGFAVNQVDSTVTVIDASTNAVIGSGEVVKDPDQVTFTSRYAYVRGTGTEKFSLVEINEVAKKGVVAAANIQAGRQAASVLPGEIGVADMIQPTPEGNAVMIASTPDQMMYYYVEGMMAPMGTFQNYKRRPHALMLIDRSLAETGPGVYSSPVKLKTAGQFDVPFIIDQPRLINCFDAAIATSPDGDKARAAGTLAVEALFKGNRFKPGESVPLRFKITDSITKQAVTGLKDVQVLVFEPPGVWQQRQWAKEVGGGVYELTQVFPQAALYNVMVQVASRGVKFNGLQMTAVPVANDPAGAEAKDARKNAGGINE